jgi:hypothetical protein
VFYLFAGAPAVAADTPALKIAVSASATSVSAGTSVVFTATLTNTGTTSIDMSNVGEYDGAGGSLGLWLPDPASCTVATGGGGAGGSENVCFEKLDTTDACLSASAGWPDGWAWTGYFTSDRPSSLAPGASLSCTIGVRVLRALPSGSGLALEAWASPDGYEHFPSENQLGTNFVTVTVPAVGTSSGAKVTGSTNVGKTLTASRGFTGPWDQSVTYQWLRNGKTITGATASTYALTATDEGTRISARVTGRNTKGLGPAGGTRVTFTSPQTSPINPGTFSSAPKPVVRGTAKVGSKLTAIPGTWKPTATLSYRWYRGSTPITNATKSAYSVTSADLGKTLAVKVTAKKAGYVSTTIASTKTAKVVAGTLTAATPKISGTAKVGKTLTAKPGTWTAGTKLTYQWYSGGTKISGATKPAYTLKSAQKGKWVKVKVTGKKTGYATVTKTSSATAKVR